MIMLVIVIVLEAVALIISIAAFRRCDALGVKITRLYERVSNVERQINDLGIELGYVWEGRKYKPAHWEKYTHKEKRN